MCVKTCKADVNLNIRRLNGLLSIIFRRQKLQNRLLFKKTGTKNDVVH